MNKFRTYGAVVLSMVFWSFSFIWFKVANEYYRPIAIVFVRLVLAVMILGAYLIIKKKNISIDRTDRRLFFMLGFFEPFLYFLGESFGLTFVSSTTASVIISTIPVVATVGAWVILKERLSFLNYAGIILSFAGVIVFVLNKDGSLSFNLNGLLLLTFAVFSAVGYNLTLSKLVGNYSPVIIVFVQNVIGGVLFLPLFLMFEMKPFFAVHHTLITFKPIIELSVFASCAAFILFAYSVKNMGISKTNVFSNSIPMFTAIFSFFLLGEKLTFQNIIGMVVVILGLFLSQIHAKKQIIDDALVFTGKTA